MRLYLLRHGEAEARAATDEQRQLTDHGHRANQRLAGQLEQQQLQTDRALCSPYTRARQTAAELSSAFGAPEVEECGLLVPETPPQLLLEHLQVLAVEAGLESLLLVGHNPLLSRLIALLLDGDARGTRYLDTSNLVCLNCQVLAPACGELCFWMTP